MNDQNYSISFTTNHSAEEVFAAINNVRGWWSEEIKGPTDKLGAQFTYHHENVHRCKMKITEFVPGEKVVWLVLDNYFNFTEDKTEWTGTKIIFEVTNKDAKTQLRFTHEGLVPEYECFKVCSNAWGSYINGSLQSLITTGKGRPNPKEKKDGKRAS